MSGPVWNERYAAPGYAYGTEPNDFLRSHAQRLPKGRILSLAEGEGRNAVYLARMGYDVTAVDASEVGLSKARQLAAEHGVKIQTIVADLAEFTIDPDTWDGIISIYCHLPPDVRSEVHRSVVRGLTPGGVYLLEGFNPEQPAYGTGGPKSAELLMSLSDLRRELEGLEFIHGAETVRDVHEGTYHTGRSAVVQIIARKAAA